RRARRAQRHALRSAHVGEMAQAPHGPRAHLRVSAHVLEGAAVTSLERTIGIVLRIGVAASSTAHAAGLVLEFLSVRAATWFLNVGALTLLATPAARVVVSIVEYVDEREWTFVTLTSIVLAELLASVMAALVFNKRL